MGIAGLEVRTKLHSDSTWGPIVDYGPTLVALITALSAGNEYDVEGRIYDYLGVRSDWSAIGEGFTVELPSIPTNLQATALSTTEVFLQWGPSYGGPDLSAPTDLAVTGFDASSVSFSWTASHAADALAGDYRLKRATDAGFTTGVVDIDVGNALSYHDTTVVPGTTYYYKVEVVSGIDHSGFSSAILIAVPQVVVPTALVNLTQGPTGTFTNTAGPGTFWLAHCQTGKKLPGAADGAIQLLPALGNPAGGVALGFMQVDNVGTYTTIDYGIFQSGGEVFYLDAGAAHDAFINYVAGDVWLMTRVSGVISAWRVRAGVPTLAHQFTGTYGSDLFLKVAVDNPGDSFSNFLGAGLVDKP